MSGGYQQHFKKIQNQKMNSNHSMNVSDRTGYKKNKQANLKQLLNKELNEKSISDRQINNKQMSSKQIREHLQAQIHAKNLKKSKSFPKGLILFSILGLAVAFVGLNYLNDVERFVKKAEISFFGYAGAEEKTPAQEDVKAKDQSPAKEAEKKTEEVQQAKHDFTDEEINHFTKLNERKKELDAREQELNRMEAELLAQKSELEKRMGELSNTRREISSVLDDKVKADDQKVDSLVSVYSSMKPQQAAKVFETMDEDLAIEILGRMKKKPAAEILNLVKAEKAQVLSERYAGYKRK